MPLRRTSRGYRAELDPRYDQPACTPCPSTADAGPSFAYDPSFRGPAISAGMPLQEKPFSPHRTETFFHALAPEGETQLDFLRLMRANRSDWLPFLKRLGDKSSGTLVFSLENEAPGTREVYDPVGEDYINCLLGNCDNNPKNFSALYDQTTRSGTFRRYVSSSPRRGLPRRSSGSPSPWVRGWRETTSGARPKGHAGKGGANCTD